MKKNIAALILLIVVFICGCIKDTGIVETKYENQFLLTTSTAELPYLVAMPEKFDPATELRKIEDFYHELGADDIVALSLKDWKTIDKEYRLLLKQYEAHSYFNCLRQVLAQNILIKKGLLDIDSQEAINAVAFYTEELSKSGSANTPLIYNCLSKLRSKWKNSKLNEIGQHVVHSYDDLVKRNQLLIPKEVRTEDTKQLNPMEQKLYNKITAMKEKAEKMQAEYAKKLVAIEGK